MAKRVTFTDRLTEFMAVATEAELHTVAGQISLAIRLRFGAPAVAKPKRVTRQTLKEQYEHDALPIGVPR